MIETGALFFFGMVFIFCAGMNAQNNNDSGLYTNAVLASVAFFAMFWGLR